MAVFVRQQRVRLDVNPLSNWKRHFRSTVLHELRFRKLQLECQRVILAEDDPKPYRLHEAGFEIDQREATRIVDARRVLDEEPSGKINVVTLLEIHDVLDERRLGGRAGVRPGVEPDRGAAAVRALARHRGAIPEIVIVVVLAGAARVGVTRMPAGWHDEIGDRRSNLEVILKSPGDLMEASGVGIELEDLSVLPAIVLVEE